MQDFGIGNVFKTTIYNKVEVKSTQTTNCQSIYIQNQCYCVEFAAVSLPVWKASEASKKFLKHVVLFVLL